MFFLYFFVFSENALMTFQPSGIRALFNKARHIQITSLDILGFIILKDGYFKPELVFIFKLFIFLNIFNILGLTFFCLLQFVVLIVYLIDVAGPGKC